MRATALAPTQLGELVEDLDEQAWSGPDPDDASQDLHTFLQARAANALYFARDPAAISEQAAESLYESVIALDEAQVMELLRTFTAPTTSDT